MAKKRTTNKEDNSVVGLETHLGTYIVLDYAPSEEVVRNFVTIQNEKFRAGRPGNDTSVVTLNPAFLIKSAARFENYDDAVNNQNRGEEIDISDL